MEAHWNVTARIVDENEESIFTYAELVKEFKRSLEHELGLRIEKLEITPVLEGGE